MKIDLEIPLKTIKGIPIKETENTDFTTRTAILGVLLTTKKGDSIRNWRLSQKINLIDRYYEPDKDEISYIEERVKEWDNIALIKGQLLEILSDVQKLPKEENTK